MTKQAPRGIIWLASYPKSGNTWTRHFLHNLINVMAGEDAAPQSINRMNSRSMWEISAARYQEVLGKKAAEATLAEIAAARHEVQRRMADEANGLAFVKTHHALMMDRGHTTINFNVTSGAIYIVRNPLDVAISFSHHLDATIDDAIERMALKGLETPVTEQAVYEVYGSWSQNVESWTRKPHRTIYVMRYEDMLADPRKAFGGLARHLRISPTRKQLARAIELSSFERLAEQEQTEGFLEKPEQAERFFRRGEAGQWRDELTGAQVERIVADHRAQMERFGYHPLPAHTG